MHALQFGRRAASKAIRHVQCCFCGTKPSDAAKTHFGFEVVDEMEKKRKVHGVFENVADKYDLMNDAMSFGLHRMWKSYFVHRLNAPNCTRLLDVAGGTGDIAFRVVNRWKNKGRSGHVTICDINQPMLDVCKQKAVDRGIADDVTLVCGNAESLPFDEGQFDAYTIAFGIRNCTHVDKVLAEAHRVLRPGGRFMCLEFSAVQNPAFGRIYDWYSFQIIPVLGQLLAADWKSYQYLVESIRQFPDQDKFGEMIRSTGFTGVNYENLSNGIVAIHSGFKRNKQDE